MLNQTAIYALRAMGFLAAHNTGKPVQSALISQEMDIPHNFLSKILNRFLRQVSSMQSAAGVAAYNYLVLHLKSFFLTWSISS